MKDTKAKLINNSMFEIDSCRAPQETGDSAIDDQLLVTLDNELSNSMHNKIRKIIQNRNVSLIPRHALNKNETQQESFTIK